jgi:hypothetical protein
MNPKGFRGPTEVLEDERKTVGTSKVLWEERED